MTTDHLADLLRQETEGTLPELLHFWGHRPRADGRIGKSCLSQWWPVEFTVEGETYRSAEHFMMVGKARLFDDEDAARRILDAGDPQLAKKLGRTVRGFDPATWAEQCFDVVVRGNEAKFGQHPDLAAFLRSTAPAVLVEASPSDAIWGIGLAAADPRAATPSTWAGTNLLGFALMAVRDRL